MRASKLIQLSRTSIDDCIWDIQNQLACEHGSVAAERMISPLVWYVGTNRASSEFLLLLLNAAPRTRTTVVKALAKNESDSATIARICKILHYIPTF